MNEKLTHGITIVTTIMTAFGSSLTNMAPPAEVGGIDIPAIGSVIGLMLYLVSFLAVKRFKPNKTLILLGSTLGIAAFLVIVVLYSRKLDQTTFTYEGTRMVRAEYTPMAVQYRKYHLTVTDEEMFNREGGSQEKIWTKESLQSERQALFMWYLSLLSIFFIAMFPIALFIAEKPSGKS